MFFTFAERSSQQQPSPSIAWRWRYIDPRTGEAVTHSEPMTTEQMRSITPCAEVIPGSRMLLSGRWFPRAVPI